MMRGKREDVEGLRHLSEEEKEEYRQEFIDRLIYSLSESRNRNDNNTNECIK